MGKAVYSFSDTFTSTSAATFNVMTEWDLAGFSTGLFLVTMNSYSGTTYSNVQFYLMPMNPATGDFALDNDFSSTGDGGQYIVAAGQPLPRTGALHVGLGSTAYKFVVYMANAGETVDFAACLVARD